MTAPRTAPSRRRFLQACSALPLVQLAASAHVGAGETIDRIEAFAVRYPMTGHFKFFTGPHGALGRASVLVKITTDSGRVGWGQSVPIARWSYETLETVELVLRDYFGPALLGHDPTDLIGAHARMSKTVANGFSTGMPIARAGIDLALHDLLGKLAGQSIAELWGRKPGGPLRLSWTLNPRDLDETEALVEEGRRRGYRDFNIKVAPDPEFDLELARRVRALAPEAFLWADANGGYEPAVAFAVAPRLAEAGVDVLEAPMLPNRISGYQALRKQAALPILMDEGVVSPVELHEFIQLGMLDGVAMKPARCGGLLSGRRQIELLEENGLLWLGSGLTDPDVSLAATLLLYGAYGLDRPAALNGPQFLTTSLLKEPLQVVDGTLAPPTGPGLGVEVDEELLGELVAATAFAASASSTSSAKRSQPPEPPPTSPLFDLRWEEVAAESLTLCADGRVLWSFHHSQDAPHSFFHPLALPGTRAITRDAPSDHVWHHGLWFSWKYINGVNYWEHEQGTQRPAGRTRTTDVRVEANSDHSARIKMSLEYAPGEQVSGTASAPGLPVLSEERVLEVSPPASDGSYAIVWQGRFTALAESVVLDRTPPPGRSGGKAWGGYAGLSLRLADLDERAVVSPDGPVSFNGENRYRARHRALEYSGGLDGQPVGIAVLELPDNPNTPSPWYAIRSDDMTFFSPAVICIDPMQLRRGESFTLRYRIHVHPGRWDAARLAEALQSP